MQRKSREKIFGFLLATLIFVGACVRGFEISRPIVWHDETYTLIAISGHTVRATLAEWKNKSKIKPLTLDEIKQSFQAPHGSSLRSVSIAVRADQSEHPPGYFQGLYLWCRLFGTLIAIQRLYSVFWGILGMAAFYWLGMELFKVRRTALLATALMALSPLHIMYSVELREYGAGFFFFCLTSFLVLRALRLRRLRDWALYSCSVAGGIYFSYLIVLISLGHLLYAAVRASVVRGSNKAGIKSLLIASSAVALSLVAVLPLFFGLWEHWGVVQHTLHWLSKPARLSCLVNAWLFSPLFNWIFHPKFWFEGCDPSIFDPYLPAMMLLIVLELYCCYFLIKKAKKQAAFLFSICFVLAGFFWGQDLFFGGMRSTIVRYFLPIPMMAIFPVAFTLERFWISEMRARRALALICFAFLLACQTVNYIALPAERGKFRYSILKLAEFLRAEPSTIVMVDHNYESVQFVLALSHLRPEQPFAWIKVPPPDWLSHEDHVYIMHANDDVTKKYEHYGFEVLVVDKMLKLYRLQPKNRRSQ